MPEQKLPTIYGFEIRSPYPGEMQYFARNPKTAGMMTEDNRIILNPASGLSNTEKMAVAENEAIRLWLKSNNIKPDFDLSDSQMSFFKSMGADYAKPENKLQAQHTIIARALTGDPSVGKLTEQQQKWVNTVKSKLPKR